MERYIDANKLHYSRVRVVHTDGTIGGFHAVVMSAEIKCAPTADVVEVEVLKDWLMAMDLNCVGETGDIPDAIVSIAERLDGLRAFARERREVIDG